jgi:phage tail sheath protein FI
MAMAYPSPGVYVEEIPSAIKPIAGVSTSVAAFIGVVPDMLTQIARDVPAADGTPQVKYVQVSLAGTPAKKPLLITNWTQFTKAFGDVIGDPANTTVVAAANKPSVDAGHRNLAQAVYGFLNNGGSRCYVVRITDPADTDAALKALAAIDEISLVLAPGMTASAVRSSLITHCQHTSGRFAILDLDDLDTATAATKMPSNSDLAAVYHPWVRVFDPATKLATPAGDGSLGIPPSGHLAGIYARVDDSRGVHKAPANEVVLGALDVARLVSKADQDGVNNLGLNCIRIMNGNVLVWGARTVGGDRNADLKYVSVRRTLLFLRKSIEQGTQWVVFEPNTSALWQKITRNISAFLTNVWRSGALFGDTPAQAFYVKCDAETNPPELRDLGQVVTEVGVAIARPAEFVIFRISQVALS